MSATVTGSSGDPFGEVHEFLELLKDLTPNEKAAAGPAIQRRVDVAATQYPSLIPVPIFTHVSLTRPSMHSQSLTPVIASNITESNLVQSARADCCNGNS